MGKGKKTKKKFNYEKDRRREWRKKKKTPTINCEAIKNSWDAKKSLKANLAQMGLAFNPNETSTSNDKNRKTVPVNKPHVVEELEQIASTTVPVKLTMSQPDMQFCKYMSEKYGEDYVVLLDANGSSVKDIQKWGKKRVVQMQTKAEMCPMRMFMSEFGGYNYFGTACALNEDFKAMTRDLKNYYQETPKQIKRKIRKYFEVLRERKL